MGMFGRFTERAQRVISFAQQMAQQLGHNYVGTEHLLLGIIKEEESIAAKALKNLGVEIEQVQQIIIQSIGTGNKPTELLGYTPRTKKVFELSIGEARNLNHNYVGTEHLLLGIIKAGDGIATKILAELGVNLQNVRAEVLKLLSSGGASGNQKGSPASRGKNTPTLDQFGRDLNELAREGKIDPVIGRTKEINRIIQILSRRTKNNP
ncbi:MAG: ATP-dependent Clp protease ATP-binding subunit ClpC, partial [Clostridiales bacterium]|nr:ATP-dependent Clp protease ATP-binding subunit ClpC [Clostridiales bacterium]